MDTQTRRRFNDQLYEQFARITNIITCCRSPYGPLADEVAAWLRVHGYRARRLALGLPDWRALGLPIETTTVETYTGVRDDDNQ